MDHRPTREPRRPPPAHAPRRRPRSLAARAQDRRLRPHRTRPATARRAPRARRGEAVSSPSLELPTLTAPPTGPQQQSMLEPAERDRLIRRAKALSWLSLAYMTAEGAIAIAAAVLAGSVALLGFGLDSAIEALASIIVIWRFTGTRRLSDHAEQRAQRLVAITFFLLAPYIAQDAIRALISGEHPATSWLGIALSISSIIVMPLLGRAKL